MVTIIMQHVLISSKISEDLLLYFNLKKDKKCSFPKAWHSKLLISRAE